MKPQSLGSVPCCLAVFNTIDIAPALLQWSAGIHHLVGARNQNTQLLINTQSFYLEEKLPAPCGNDQLTVDILLGWIGVMDPCVSAGHLPAGPAE